MSQRPTWVVAIARLDVPVRGITQLIGAIVFEGWMPEERKVHRVSIKEESGQDLYIRDFRSEGRARRVARDIQAALATRAPDDVAHAYRLRPPK